jgi:hypothetical protein
MTGANIEFDAGGKERSQVEITSEMINAGLDALFLNAASDNHISADCIADVYIAMEKARVRGSRENSESLLPQQ